MKFILSALLLLNATAFANVKIQEELYLPGIKPMELKDMISTGSVIVDHVSSEGFELYGPQGLKAYLDGRNIPYLDMKAVNKSVMADYPTHAEITAKLKAAVAARPDIMQMFSIGKSVKGKELWVVKISDNVSKDEVEPEFKYISSMHGDEITGRELTTFLIEEIAAKYGKDADLTELVNNTEIYIMPSMNPDGSEMRQRANAKGVDLNRNFPDITKDRSSRLAGQEIETQAVMKFQDSRQFVLSANFHGGAVVMNYAWDSKYERHTLDAFLIELASIYSNENPEMRASSEFAGGITNGADWYVVKGGMQDWSIFFYNDLQFTVELSDAKWPRYADIPGFYKSNRDSMVEFMKQVHLGAGFKMSRAGVAGSVLVKQTSPVTREIGTYAFKGSEFYKVLPEGEYEFVITEKNKSAKRLAVSVEKGSIKKDGNYFQLQ